MSRPPRRVFFPPPQFERKDEKLGREERAKAICATCPVREPCLGYALRIREPHGIWGGFSEAERRAAHHPAGLTARAARPASRGSGAGADNVDRAMTTAGDHDAPERALAGPFPDPGPIVWKRAFVDGRPAAYGVIGHGLPVLFLHGWALGHHSYRAVARRIAARGCQVYTPGLPGSGSTADLPDDQVSLAGYGRGPAASSRPWASRRRS